MHRCATCGLVFGVVLAAVLLAGCAARTEYHAAGVEVSRQSWDTLGVAAHFIRQTTFSSETVRPDTVFVSVFGGAYDTLYAGPGAPAVVPDPALGSREPLLVEACGAFGRRTICQQETIYASPKRVQAAPRIEYPEDAHFEQGRYDLGLSAERRRFGGEGWERLEPQPLPTGYLLAYVAGQPDEPVRIPFAQAEGRFDLARYKGYEDFRFFLRSRLFGGETASVVFDVHAGLGRGRAVPVSTVAREVRMKTEEERAEVVRLFAQQAARQIAARLGGGDEPERVAVYVDEWAFRRFENTYVIELEMRWRGGRRNVYALSGELNVAAGGEGAAFRPARANYDARRRWRREVEDEVLRLEALDPDYVEEGEERAERAEAQTAPSAAAW